MGTSADQRAREETGDLTALREEIDRLWWYHTLELAPGVETPGWFDLRGIVDRVPFGPLEGKRCLDVGTFDGFWAFEMERRGASEVVAIDVLDTARLDWPADTKRETIDGTAERKSGGRGFELAKERLGSSVERLDLSVYDLDPELVGTFDVVFLGSLLVHLRDPVGALRAVRSVCAERFVVVESIDLPRSLFRPSRPRATLEAKGRPWWWQANVAGLTRMVEAAGFRIASGPGRLFLPRGANQPLPRLGPGVLLKRNGWYALMLSRWGEPHAALAAVPA